MAITARMARKKYPNAKTVFVGPCVAKKTERLLQKNRGNIDYVLTFEEITAMFAAKGIDPIQLQGESNVVPGSPSGRNFCVTGGVAGSLNAYLQEIGETERLTLKKANGNVECIKFVKELQAGKQVYYHLKLLDTLYRQFFHVLFFKKRLEMSINHLLNSYLIYILLCIPLQYFFIVFIINYVKGHII